MPGTPAEAVELFGDGGNVTVIGGGTIVVPAVAAGRIAPARALFLDTPALGHHADRPDGHDRRDHLGRLACRARRAARRVRGERRRPGGARPGHRRRQPLRDGDGQVPRGDLQGALLALDAQVRSQGGGGERDRGARAVPRSARGTARARRLAIASPRPAPSPRSATRTRTPTRCSRSRRRARRTARSGSPRAGSRRAARLHAAERLADDPEAAGAAAASEASFADDALASAWYRAKTLPVLVRRALTQLKESR